MYTYRSILTGLGQKIVGKQSDANSMILLIGRKRINGFNTGILCIFRFFSGDCGAFTLFEATPEFLKVSQINDYGNELHKTKLKPRTVIQSLDDEENTMLDEFFTSQS